MKGYSKNSVLGIMTALGTSIFFGGVASAQQYSPVSVDNNVQVNWDVADGLGGQPTVPQYLSPTVSRNRIMMPGGDLIYPETQPKSAFLAADQFASNGSVGGYDNGFETVVIGGSSQDTFPTQSEFYGVPGVTTGVRTDSGRITYDDGANQVIALRQPAPTASPRSKPATPTASARATAPSASAPAPTPLTKPAPAPAAAPAPALAEAAPAAPAAPTPETAEAVAPAKMAPTPLVNREAPAAPPAPAVAPLAGGSDIPVAPAPSPDTTTPAPKMAAAPAATPAPKAPAEEAAIPPTDTSPVPSTSAGAGEFSLGFATGSFELTSAAKNELDQVIAAMSNDESLRIQLQAYAKGDGTNASKARRLSLSRALQVRSYLIDKGVRSTRIDVRALGANVPSGPADRVDIKTVQR